MNTVIGQSYPLFVGEATRTGDRWMTHTYRIVAWNVREDDEGVYVTPVGINNYGASGLELCEGGPDSLSTTAYESQHGAQSAINMLVAELERQEGAA